MTFIFQGSLYIYQGIEIELIFGQGTDVHSPMGKFTVWVDGGDLAVSTTEGTAAAVIEKSWKLDDMLFR